MHEAQRHAQFQRAANQRLNFLRRILHQPQVRADQFERREQVANRSPRWLRGKRRAL